MPPSTPAPRQIAHDTAAPSQRTAWADTEPAALDLLAPAHPGQEALQGLQVRELHGSALFRRYFGDRASPMAASAPAP